MNTITLYLDGGFATTAWEAPRPVRVAAVHFHASAACGAGQNIVALGIPDTQTFKNLIAEFTSEATFNVCHSILPLSVPVAKGATLNWTLQTGVEAMIVLELL